MKTTLTKDDPAGWYLCDCLDSEGVRARWWSGNALKTWPTDDWLCKERYTNFRRLYTEEDAAAMGQRCDELFAANQTLQFQVSTLASDLEKAKASPYHMRKADKPDCAGLWKMKDCDPFEEYHINGEYPEGPYYYLGPIPVIPAEQKPPQVVRVKCKTNSITMRAIPTANGTYMLLSDDGLTCGETKEGAWEVVK